MKFGSDPATCSHAVSRVTNGGRRDGVLTCVDCGARAVGGEWVARPQGFGPFVVKRELRPGNPAFGRRLDQDARARVLGSYRDTPEYGERLELAARTTGVSPGEYIRRALRAAYFRDLPHVLDMMEDGP